MLHRNLQRFRGGLVFKTFVSLNSRLASDKEDEGCAQSAFESDGLRYTLCRMHMRHRHLDSKHASDPVLAGVGGVCHRRDGRYTLFRVYMSHGQYRGTSLIRNSSHPQGVHRALGIVLL